MPAATATSYIESSSSNFYRSTPADGDIPLKRKFVRVGSAPRQNHHSDNQRRGPARRKISQKEKALLPTQPDMIMHLDFRGGYSCNMMTREQFIAAGGWA